MTTQHVTIESLHATLVHLCTLVGARLTLAEVAARLRVHRNTIGTYMRTQDFQKPGKDGKWLLSEVM